MIYQCTHPGCCHQVEADEAPRHTHGQAQVQMRPIQAVRGSYFIDRRDKNRAAKSYSE